MVEKLKAPEKIEKAGATGLAAGSMMLILSVFA